MLVITLPCNELSATLQYNDSLTNSGSFNSVWLEVAVLSPLSPKIIRLRKKSFGDLK